MLKKSAFECVLISDEFMDNRLYDKDHIVCHIKMHHFKNWRIFKYNLFFLPLSIVSDIKNTVNNGMLVSFREYSQ
jgi:hypothetical protein